MFNARQHAYLISVFKDTISHIESDEQLRSSVTSSITGQQFIAEGSSIPLPEPSLTTNAQVIISRLRSFEAARVYATQGYKVAVLNFASSTNPGGGVASGASAQEECLCRVSTLYPCLKDERMWNSFYSPHRLAANPLHSDDIIYTKDVVVIKDDDYKLLEKPFTVDVITCAAPTLREKTTNRYNPSDGDKAPEITNNELLCIHKSRGRQILSTAAYNGVDVLILGAFGCGAFRNDPYVVAKAYSELLPMYLKYFRIVEFAIFCRPRNMINYDAFRETIGSRF